MAQTILITSGKGGAGKSVVCAHLGGALAQLGKRVLLVEASNRAMDVVFGVSDRVLFDMGDFAEQRCAVSDLLIDLQGQQMQLVCAPINGEGVSDAATWQAFAKDLPEVDFVLIEADGMRPAMLEGIAAICDRAVIVCTPDFVNARMGRAISDTLFSWGMEDIRLCINQLSEDFVWKRPVPDLDYMIDQVCAQLIALIPYMSELGGSIFFAQTLNLSNLSKNIFDNFAQRILGNYIDLSVC